MRPRRILLVGLNYAPEPVGIGPYSAGLAEELAARGHHVEAVVGKPYYPQWRPDPDFAKGGWRRSVENGVSLVRCPHYVPRAPTGLRRVLHLASFALSALGPALRAAWRGRPEVVVAVAPALLSVPVAWLAARLAGAKLWIHLQDFEVDAAGATGLIESGGAFAMIAFRFESIVLRSADRVSSISPKMCERLAAKGVDRHRISEIRNWADPRFAPDPTGAETLRREWGVGQRQVLLYSGNIARKQGIEVLVEAACLLADRNDLVFVICGEGPNRAALAALAAGLDNIRIMDLQPAERMGALLALASIHLLPQIAGAADLVLPSKLTNMLASGRPVIATAPPESVLFQEVEGCGMITPPGDASALAEAIATLAADPDRRARYGAEAARRATERWSKAAILDRFEAAMDGLDD